MLMLMCILAKVLKQSAAIHRQVPFLSPNSYPPPLPWRFPLLPSQQGIHSHLGNVAPLSSLQRDDCGPLELSHKGAHHHGGCLGIEKVALDLRKRNSGFLNLFRNLKDIAKGPGDVER